MGWSESYYEDARKEAEGELLGLSAPLHAALEDFRAAVACYRDFVEHADEVEALLRRLDELLPGCDSV